MVTGCIRTQVSDARTVPCGTD